MVEGAGRPLVVEGVRVIDGTGNPPLEDAVVVVVGERIVAVGPRGQVPLPALAERVVGEGRTLLPGLIDVHVHDPSEANLVLYLKNGVTSIRFAGGHQPTLRALRDRIARGETLGPRVFSVGPAIDGTPHAWPGSLPVDSPIEARRLVRRLVEEEEVDALLATHRVTRPVLAAIVETAHALGVPVTGQLWTCSARDAIAVGMDGLENTTRIPESAAFPPARLFSYRSVSQRLAILAHLWVETPWAELAELARQLAASGIALAPELVSFEGWARANEGEVKADRNWPSAPDDPQVQAYERHVAYLTRDWSPDDVAAQRAAVVRYREFCRVFHEAGGLLVAGTDMGFGGILLHRELWHFQQAGLDALAVIRTATRQAASALGRADLGLVAVGALADLVLVNGNPLDDLAALRQVEAVFIGGRPVVQAGAVLRPAPPAGAGAR
ncbi:MAG: amidohydrolase [Dehalococcoidia bacterium]|nr:MAG: amidohydrolase [Dehalococcoidia bacterium]